MSDEFERAQRFLLRAEEVRAIADGVQEQGMKQSLLKIAADYEKMATTLFDIDRSNAMPRAVAMPHKH